MFKRAFFVINPNSGKSQIKGKLLEVLSIFSKAGMELGVYATHQRFDAYNSIKENGADYELVISSGGDGTLSESVKGLMAIDEDKRPVLGYIPAGTTNDFATTLKLPKNPVKAAENIVAGNIFKCDAGDFNGDYFIYIAAFGAFTDVAYDTPQEMKNFLGHTAYIIEGIKRVPNLARWHMKAEYDGKTVEDDFIYGMISNTRSVAGMKSLAKENVKLDDGVFEVVLIRMPQNPVDLQNILTGLVTQDMSSDMFCKFKASKVKFTSDVEVPWTLDGEYGGKNKEVVIKNHRRAISIIVDEKVATKAFTVE